jgi:hypothetical protein
MKNKALFWAIGLLGLAWNGIGLLNFIMQQNPANLEQMPELFRTIVATRPLWATIAFGLAVASGALGSILLLLRHKLSVLVNCHGGPHVQLCRNDECRRAFRCRRYSTNRSGPRGRGGGVAVVGEKGCGVAP